VLTTGIIDTVANCLEKHQEIIQQLEKDEQGHQTLAKVDEA
jgi:hypothetical protein